MFFKCAYFVIWELSPFKFTIVPFLSSHFHLVFFFHWNKQHRTRMGLEVEEPITTTSQFTAPETMSLSSPQKIQNNLTVTSTLPIVQPHALLPKPVPPTASLRNDVTVSSAFGKFFHQRRHELSSAISRGISTLKPQNDDALKKNKNEGVTEFNLSGLKVFVAVKKNESFSQRRISFFSRSNCRECGAVRTFFRERAVRFVEINVDVFTEREKELRERTGSTTVPKIFFGEKLIGGLVELNALRKDGNKELERQLKEAEGEGPAAPVYGFDEAAEEAVKEEAAEETLKVVKVLRQRLPIQDRLLKMKIAKNCFAGSELVELLVRNHGYAPTKVFSIQLSFCFFFSNFLFIEFWVWIQLG